MPSIHSMVRTLCVVRSSRPWARESPDRCGCSPPSPTARRLPAEDSISIATERDMVLMTSTSRSRRRFGRIDLGLVRDKEEIGKVAPEARGHIGPQHLHRHGCPHAVAFDFAAMHLRDRGGRDRRAEARKRFCHRAFERGGDDGLRLALGKRRQNRSCKLSRSRAIMTPTTSGRVARN